MQYVFMILTVLGITAADQISKYLVLEYIPYHGHVDVIPGVFSLTHAHNTGAAFSSFQGMQWLFLLLFVLFTAAIIWEFVTKHIPDLRIGHCHNFNPPLFQIDLRTQPLMPQPLV